MMHQMMDSWVQTQRQMIDQWLDRVEDGTARPSGDLWDQTLSVWKSSVKRTMEAQTATMNAWMRQLQDVDGMPDEAAEQVEQGKTIVKQWSETQHELWDRWFETMEEMDPSAYESGWQRMATQSVSTWRNYMDQIQELNESFASMATGSSDDE